MSSWEAPMTSPLLHPCVPWGAMSHDSAPALRRPGTRAAFLTTIGVILVLLWLPNLRYPITADPVGYAHLSRSLWETGTYQIRGKPDDVFVPMHPIVSYPFLRVLGMNDGMKVASLVYGILLTWIIFAVVAREARDAPWLPYAVVALLTLSSPTTWLLSVGNADTLYALLFYATLLLYLHAEQRTILHLVVGILAGMTMLTRYMGVALLPLIAAHAIATRRSQLRHPAFLALFPIAVGLFSLWFVRHKVVFGTFLTFHATYALADPLPLWQRVLSNTWFYANPLHNVLLLFPFLLIGLLLHWRRHLLSTLGIPLSLLLCYVYPSVTSRFLIATTPFLLTFTARGIQEAWRHTPQLRTPLAAYVALALSAQVGLTCLYTLPRCNAVVDRLGLPLLPRDLHFSQEGAESIQESVDWINVHAVPGATVIGAQITLEDLPVWRNFGRLRPDLDLNILPSCRAPTYEIRPLTDTAKAPLAYTTGNAPPYAVRIIPPQECRLPLDHDPFARSW